jgi:flagellar capping protein FliD
MLGVTAMARRARDHNVQTTVLSIDSKARSTDSQTAHKRATKHNNEPRLDTQLHTMRCRVAQVPSNHKKMDRPA